MMEVELCTGFRFYSCIECLLLHCDYYDTVGKYRILTCYWWSRLWMFSEKERVQVGITESTACMWTYLTQLRKQSGKEHAHYNLFYDRATYSGALLPPAAALAPSVWPQYFLRWSCPSLASTGNCAPTGWTHGGDLEVASHEFAESFYSVQKVSRQFNFRS